MPAVKVSQDQCKSAKYAERLETEGLDTCIGIVAYGMPAKKGGINKVMAHSSTGNEAHIIGNLFVRTVQQSGMTIYGVCISWPKVERNDHGKGKVTNSQIKDLMVSMQGYNRKTITQDMVDAFRDRLSLSLADAQDRAEQYCIDLLKVGPVSHPRSISRIKDPYPFGALVATASPGGVVKADGHKMADIPDWQEPAAAPAPEPQYYEDPYGGGGGSGAYDQYYQGQQYYASGSSDPYYGGGGGPSGTSGTYAMRPKGGSHGGGGGSSYSQPSGYGSSSRKGDAYYSSSSSSARKTDAGHGHSTPRREVRKQDTGHSESRRDGSGHHYSSSSRRDDAAYYSSSAKLTSGGSSGGGHHSSGHKISSGGGGGGHKSLSGRYREY